MPGDNKASIFQHELSSIRNSQPLSFDTCVVVVVVVVVEYIESAARLVFGKGQQGSLLSTFGCY
jgi:hypothetical protein